MVTATNLDFHVAFRTELPLDRAITPQIPNRTQVPMLPQTDVLDSFCLLKLVLPAKGVTLCDFYPSLSVEQQCSIKEGIQRELCFPDYHASETDSSHSKYWLSKVYS